jgi:hypothetical protein
MTAHLFRSEDGGLYDTRATDWPSKPLRPLFARHARLIETGAELRAALRAGDYAWPGGYECYFITSDGGVLCFDAVRAELRSVLHSIRHQSNDGWRVVALESTAEADMEDIVCDHTGRVIYHHETENDQ